AVRDLTAERFKALARGDERAACDLVRLLPTGGLQHSESARRLCGEPRGSLETRIAGIAADAFGDRYRNIPRVLWGGAKDAEAALAQMIEGAASVERAESGLEADTPAIARGAQRRADHLRSERG